MAVGKESIKRAANASAGSGTKTKTARTARNTKAAAKAETKAAEKPEVKTAVAAPVNEEAEKAAGSRSVKIKDELPVYLL